MREADQPKGARFPAANAKGHPAPSFIVGRCRNPECGQDFTTVAHSARRREYCSLRCRRRATRLRHPGRDAALSRKRRQKLARGGLSVTEALIRCTATRDFRVPCRTCGEDKRFGADWLGRMTESCACGTTWQTPEETGPRVRRYDQGERAMEELHRSVTRASRPSQGKPGRREAA